MRDQIQVGDLIKCILPGVWYLVICPTKCQVLRLQKKQTESISSREDVCIIHTHRDYFAEILCGTEDSEERRYD